MLLQGCTTMFHGEDMQMIRDRAYAIWQSEGHPEGRALEHWLMAERQRLASDPAQPWYEANGMEGETAFMRRMLWTAQPFVAEHATFH